MKSIEILGGGTVYHIRNHLALSAPAYGTTAKQIGRICYDFASKTHSVNVHLTKMASTTSLLETNEDVSKFVDKLIANPATKIIFFNVALVDYEASVLEETCFGLEPSVSGKYENRLKTSDGLRKLQLKPAPKLLSKIRKERKDIFLVAFKTTCGATEDDQFLTGLNLLKTSSCNLVLANDTKTHVNMIITPEQARYSVSTDRNKVLNDLVDMALARSKLTFTRSSVVTGATVPWSDERVPSSLRTVVNHCISKGAYKPFNGATVGHFAVKLDNKTFLTSKRKSDFNEMNTVGLVKVESKGTDSVIAHGSKPSVGGMSQRIIFSEHPNTDCILHFHCILKQNKFNIPVREQKFLECGSHQCGQNTSDGLKEVIPGIKVVYLDNHGPNIVFNKNIDPQKVINFIDDNFDLSQSTDQVQR